MMSGALRGESVRFPGVDVTGDCELPSVDAGN